MNTAVLMGSMESSVEQLVSAAILDQDQVWMT